MATSGSLYLCCHHLFFVSHSLFLLYVVSVVQVPEHDPLRSDDHRGPQRHLPRDQVGQGQKPLLAQQAHCRSVILILDIYLAIKLCILKRKMFDVLIC